MAVCRWEHESSLSELLKPSFWDNTLQKQKLSLRYSHVRLMWYVYDGEPVIKILSLTPFWKQIWLKWSRARMIQVRAPKSAVCLWTHHLLCINNKVLTKRYAWTFALHFNCVEETAAVKQASLYLQLTCEAHEVLRSGSERLWLSEPLGASEEQETSTARLIQSPRSHSSFCLETLSLMLWLQKEQVFTV